MLKKSLLVVLLSASAVSSVSAANITAIFGSGNPDTGWTTDGVAGDLYLGLRAKNRGNADTTNVAGVYSYATPLDPNNAARAIFNYEFSISTDGVLAGSGLDFYLAADTDPTAGISYFTVNALTFYNDNSYGAFGVTANSAGAEGTFAALGGNNNLAQNSQNIAFLGMPVNVPNATYNYELYAVTAGALPNATRVASVGITVIVGQGGAAVPDAGSSALLLGLGLAGMIALRSRRSAR
jgi:hypothetical protein